jgi:protoheme IX farnesyltransferase
LDPDSLVNAKALFRWSILYLFGLCLLLILSRTDLASAFAQQVMQLLSLPTAVQ